MPTYILRAPNGKDIEASGDHYPSVDEQAQIFKAWGADVAAPTPAPSRLTLKPEIAASMQQAGIDPTGRVDSPIMGGSLSGVEQFLQTPMVHATGNETVNALTSPANVLLAAMGVAPKAFQALSAIKAANPELLKDLAGLFKPKAIKALELAQKYAPKAEPSASPVSAAAAPPVAPAPPAAATAPAPTPSPTVEPTPNPRPANGLPDQKALNEAALARRRAEYQDRIAKATQPALELSPDEKAALVDLVSRGVSGPEALKNVLAQREMQATFGLKTPTADQIRFKKGNRGKPGPIIP